ncbi:MAG: glycosyltransferase family 2 protein [Polyangia bacterium]
MPAPDAASNVSPAPATSPSGERLFVLLPALNEARQIGTVVRDVMALRIPGVTVQAVVIDDGSRDETGALAAAAGAHVLRHEKNRGVGAAFRTGLEYARAEGATYLAHMDSDGQLLAADLARLLEPVQKGLCDLALGSRFVRGTAPPEHMARWKALALSTVARGIGVLTASRLSDISCGIRCMNRRVMDAINPTFDYDYIQETLLQALAAGARTLDVPVTALYDERFEKKGMSSRTFRYGARFLKLTAFGLARFYETRLRGGNPGERASP